MTTPNRQLPFLFLSSKWTNKNLKIMRRLAIAFHHFICIAFCQERELALKLLSNYSKIGRPIKDGTKPIQIRIGSFRLFGVDYVDELTSTLSIQGWFFIV